MTEPYTARHRMTRAFSDIAHTLEFAGDSGERITKTVEAYLRLQDEHRAGRYPAVRD